MSDNTMLYNAQLILAKSKEYIATEEIEKELNIEFIRVYSLIETKTANKESIICIYADYYDNTDNLDYTASFYFRKSVSTMRKALKYYTDAEMKNEKISYIDIEHLNIEFMCTLDIH